MGKYEKLIQKIIDSKSDENIGEKPNIQSDGNKPKAYQVKQIREIILKYKLGDK